METIILNDIVKDKTKIKYDFSISGGVIKKYFSGKDFIIEYPEDVSGVPDAILAVPFVANVLPIIWLTDSELILDELDEAFYNCIPNLKKGYEEMFPESLFLGKIAVNNIKKTDRRIGKAVDGRCAMFYSGGLDSAQTLISHLDERPTLISLWGSDIEFDNREGWTLVHNAIKEIASIFDLTEIVIHSSFRKFDDECALDRDFQLKLKDGWWHGVKHGIGMLGHVAPYAYLHNIEIMYIASSHCQESGKVRCASNPLTDNTVRYVDCKVKHDGFEYSRQDKVHNVVEFCKATGTYFPLHVCWKSQSGQNCCHCEKCFRTIAGIIAEGEDPTRYGFNNVRENISYMRLHVLKIERVERLLKDDWRIIGKRMRVNKSLIMQNEYWKDVKWMLKSDFANPEKLQLPLGYRLKMANGIRGKLAEFRFYQFCHQLKYDLMKN